MIRADATPTGKVQLVWFLSGVIRCGECGLLARVAKNRGLPNLRLRLRVLHGSQRSEGP
jgi:hypothetical protein